MKQSRSAVEELVGPPQIVFNQRMLRYYDRLLEFTCNRVWRCPIRRTLELYGQHLSSNHLEVGAGTGYFLEHSHFPGPDPRLALLDLSPHCLKRTATRLSRYAPGSVPRQCVGADRTEREALRLYCNELCPSLYAGSPSQKEHRVCQPEAAAQRVGRAIWVDGAEARCAM